MVGAPPGHKGLNAQGQHPPVGRARSPTPAQSSKDYLAGQELATITGFSVLAEKRVSLEDLMKQVEKEHKIVNELSSDVWPPKVGGVYFTEPINFVGSTSDHFNTNEVS